MGHLARLGFGCAALALGLTGCPAPDRKVLPSPRVAAVLLLTPEPERQAGHRLDVQLALSTDQPVEAVGIAYRAFPRAGWDSRDPAIVSWVLGSSAHDALGRYDLYRDALELPYDLPAGDYYLVAEVDPLGTIAEGDETDQLGAPVPFSVLDERRDQVRLMLSQASLDTDFFELTFVTTATPPEPLGLGLVVEAEAAAPVAGAAVSACLRPPGGDCASLPLGLWDQGATVPGFVASLPLPALVPGDPTAVHLDLQLPPALQPSLAALQREVATACLAGAPACAARYGLDEPFVEECLAAVSPDPARADYATLEGCLLKLIPFTVEATVAAADPALVLYDPPDASPGRTVSAPLRLLAPRPVTPVVPRPLTIRSLVDPLLRNGAGGRCTPASLDLVADQGACAEPVAWSVRPLPGWTPSWRIGTIASSDLDSGRAIYTPSEQSTSGGNRYSCMVYPSFTGLTKVLVEATACGQAASLVITETSGGADAVYPQEVQVYAGAAGWVEFRAPLQNCNLGATGTSWSFEGATDGTEGTITVDPLDQRVIRYRPPPTISGTARSLVLRASSTACGFTGTAAIQVVVAGTLAFERSFNKWFGGDLFGGGVELAAGAFVDGAGARASATAKVPLRVFGQPVVLFEASDLARVDPRQPSASILDHDLFVFGQSVSSFTCPDPANEACQGTWSPWSESKCVPEGKPPVCTGTPYLRSCKVTKDCAGLAGHSCIEKKCTKKCDEPGDCPNGRCEGALLPGPYKRTFVIVVIPVTVEGKVCAEVGLQAGLNLLTPDPTRLGFQLGPYFEVNGYASAAIGFTGILAVGVRGDIVLLRDDFYGGVSAVLEVVPAGPTCPLSEGCLRGALEESVNNVLQGGQGSIYLFADYPTLAWCGWYPCFGTARAKKTLAAWGPLYEVENRCDFCAADGICADGSPCVDGECADGGRGLLCRRQAFFTQAAPLAPAPAAAALLR